MCAVNYIRVLAYDRFIFYLMPMWRPLTLPDSQHGARQTWLRRATNTGPVMDLNMRFHAKRHSITIASAYLYSKHKKYNLIASSVRLVFCSHLPCIDVKCELNTFGSLHLFVFAHINLSNHTHCSMCLRFYLLFYSSLLLGHRMKSRFKWHKRHNARSRPVESDTILRVYL